MFVLSSISRISRISGSFFFVSFFLFSVLSADKIGSATDVSFEAIAFVPSEATDNEIMPFAYLANGFIFEDSDTVCTFSSLFPVGGSILLKGGTLKLQSDFVLELGAKINIGGVIDGAGRSFTLPKKRHHFKTDDGSSITFRSTAVKFLDDISLDSEIRFEGTSELNGYGCNLFFGGGKIVVAEDSTLILKNLSLIGLSGENLICLSDNSKVVLDDANFVLTGSFLFKKGSLVFLNKNEIMGDHLFDLQTSSSCVIKKSSVMKISGGIEVRLERSGNTEPIIFESSSSELLMSRATLHVGPAGATFTKGSVICDGDVAIKFDSTDFSTGLILGDGTAEGTIRFKLLQSSVLSLGAGHITLDLATDESSVISSYGGKMIRESGNMLRVVKGLVLNNMQLIENIGNSTEFGDEGYIQYNGCNISLLGNSFTLNGRYEKDIGFSLCGDGSSLSMETGYLFAPLSVSGEKNLISGAFKLSKPIILKDADTKLTMSYDGIVDAQIALSGGAITLASDLLFGRDGRFVGSGTILANSRDVDLGVGDLRLSSDLTWISGNSTVRLPAELELAGSWKFTGKFTLDGRNGLLRFDSDGSILVGKNSELIFKNLRIDGLFGEKILCSDSSSKITFDNVTITLSGDAVLSSGTFFVRDLLAISGPHALKYSSTAPMTVNARGTLSLSEDALFLYDPPADAGGDLLKLSGHTSKIVLSDGTISSPNVGLHLKNGTLLVEGDSYLIGGEGEDESNHMRLGDGEDPEQDLSIVLLSEHSVLNIGGNVVYESDDQ